ncbi:MAG: amidohydrolase family protein [Myxococcales bacterium]|nr:amidohydrolase family protein [Myxococcales bacterium]
MRLRILSALLVLTAGAAAFLLLNDDYPPVAEAEDAYEALLADRDNPYQALLPGEPTGDDSPRRRLIDAHSHLSGFALWSLLQPLMDSQGIDIFINLSGGSPRRGLTSGFELMTDSNARVINLMNIDYDGFGEVAWGETVAAELEIAVTRYGYAGLKVSKALGLGLEDYDGSLVAVDDPRLFPIWRKAGELGVPVFIHTSDPAAFWEPVTPENERYEELVAHPGWSFAGGDYPSRETLLTQRNHLLELFPETTFVCVHFGNNPEDLDYIDNLLATYPNAYLDTSARLAEMGRHDPVAVRDFFDRYQDRILFGTDIAVTWSPSRGHYLMLGSNGEEMPTAADIPTFYQAHWRYFETSDTEIAHPSPIQGNWTINAIDLPDEILEKVYFGNAYRLVVEPWAERNGLALPFEDGVDSPPDTQPTEDNP